MEQDLKALRRSRSLLKRRVTVTFQVLSETTSQNACGEWVHESKEKIRSLLHEIHKLDAKIIDLFSLHDIEEEDTISSQEIEGQMAYQASVEKQLHEISLKFKKGNEQVSENAKERESLGQVSSLPPSLQLPIFDGWNDQELFPSFISQFENAIGRKPNLTSSAKMGYLLSGLKGYAFNIVKHLPYSDWGY